MGGSGFVLVEAAALNKLILSSDCLSGPVICEMVVVFFLKKTIKKVFNKKCHMRLKIYQQKFLKKNKCKSKIKPFTIFGHQAKLANLLD